MPFGAKLCACCGSTEVVERHQLYPALVALTTSRLALSHIATGASTDKGRVNLSGMAEAV